jgi:hypothetical protein
MRDLCACTRRRHETSSHAPGDASFARSFDPCTSILTMLRGASLGGGAYESASRLGKLGQPRGTSTGAFTYGRSAARRVPPLPQGRGRGTSKKRKEIEVSVPARIEEFGFGCSHVVMQLQKSVGDVWPRISSANALQKERSGSSERGPSSERRSAGETVGRRVERKVCRESATPVKTARTGPRPRVARDRHSAVQTSPKAVRGSRDRGCNDHRILRRVPVDGRYPGSSRGIVFHEPVSRVV